MSHGHDHHGHDHGAGHDDHGHGHEPPTTLRGRALHAVSDFFGGHSHDPSDQIDDALEANAAGRRALVISLIALAVTAVLQGIVVAFTGSVALLGDTMHNVADAATAIPLLIAFWLARRQATKQFTYGFGRAEDLAGLFVVAMIALSAFLAGFEAIRRLIDPREVTHVWVVALAGVIGFVGNELVAQYRIRVGRQIGSAALIADGLHARADGFTSLAVVVSAAGVAVGWDWADPVIGLLIAVAIVGVLRGAVKQVGLRLMDGVEPGLTDRATHLLASVEGVHVVDDLSIRWIGHSLRAEADIAVDASLSVVEAHGVAHRAEAQLVHHLKRLDSARIHVAPAGATCRPAAHPAADSAADYDQAGA